jgi:hypothetical protein
MNHLIGRNGREIAFDLYAPKRLTNDDVAAIQPQYKTPWYGTGTKDGVYSWQTISGLQMRAYRREAYDYLVIWDLNKPQEAADIIGRVTAANNPAPTPAPEAAPQNRVVQAPNQKNDCAVVATEMYARLKKTGVWVGIALFNEKTLAPSGHAVVIWQPASGSNVQIFLDETIGTLELDTQSHELNKIFAAFNRAMGGFCNFQYVKWTAS